MLQLVKEKNPKTSSDIASALEQSTAWTLPDNILGLEIISTNIVEYLFIQNNFAQTLQNLMIYL